MLVWHQLVLRVWKNYFLSQMSEVHVEHCIKKASRAVNRRFYFPMVGQFRVACAVETGISKMF